MSFDITVESGTSVRLPTAGKYCDRDIIVTSTSKTDDGWIGDGNTYIWITLSEGRTSPMLGVRVNGTVEIDWGDGTLADILSGTNTSVMQWTPNHEYPSPGDYIIRLTVNDGSMEISGSNEYACILRHSSNSDNRNHSYLNSIRRVEIGNGISKLGSYAFSGCRALASIDIPNHISSAEGGCFRNCSSLRSITIPESMTGIGANAFNSCNSLLSAAFPNLTSIGAYSFSGCYSLSTVVIPKSMTNIVTNLFRGCYSLSTVVIEGSLASIGASAFYDCNGVYRYDFSKCTSVPTLSSYDVFNGIAEDCKICVPAALYDEWIVKTNWTVYADYIVGV